MSQFSPEEIDRIHAALRRLGASPLFAHAGRMLRFLDYAVTEGVAGRGDRVSQHALGVEVFDRDESFDPAVDSIVRVEASRLRAKLREYYGTEGVNESIRFELPKGTYEITIHLDYQVAAPTALESFAGTVSGPLRRFSVAVCPFEPISANRQDEPLGDAIATRIIDLLGGAQAFEVISRKTAFAYKGRNLDGRELGEKLGVDYLVEGNIQRADEHLRIGVGLVDARTGMQLWRSAYDRDAGGPPELADDLGASITASLNLVLWRVATERAQPGLSNDPDPAEVVQWAAAWIYFKYSREAVEEGDRRALSALQQFPNLGHLHALHAMALGQQVIHSWAQQPAEMRSEALAAAHRALELEPIDCWVLTWTGHVLSWLGEPQGAMTLAERALGREPDNPVNHGRLGEALIHLNRVAEGLAAIDTAMAASSPESGPAVWQINRSLGYSQLARYEEAAAAARLAVQLLPGAPLVWLILANALAEIDDLDEAGHAVNETRRLSPQLTRAHLEWLLRQAFPIDDQAERYVGGLDKLGFR